jgi:galactokinase
LLTPTAAIQPVFLSGYAAATCLQALCKRFHAHCSKSGLQLPAKGFYLSYDTNIPRQAGLSGSSAIICAGRQMNWLV